MRLIPPIAVSVGVTDVASSVVHTSRIACRDFAAQLAKEFGFARVDLFGSGRSGLSKYLSSIRVFGRDEVVVPAYTCWSIPAAVVRAGLRVRIVDVDPFGMGFEPHALGVAIGPRTAAVVAAHLFARGGEFSRIEPIAGNSSPTFPIVEDAAQAWPTTRAPGVSVVLLSFGRGKPMALGGGGAVLHDGPALHASNGSSGGWSVAATLAATSVLSRPSWFRIPDALPFLGIGETLYDPAFDADAPFFRWQAALGLRLLREMPALARRRSEHAGRILEAVAGAHGWIVPSPAVADGPIRLPLLAPDEATRNRSLGLLREFGVAASAMYPGTLADIPALRPHLTNPDEKIPGARAIAGRLLTLPIYPTLTEEDVDRIAAAFRRTLPRMAA